MEIYTIAFPVPRKPHAAAHGLASERHLSLTEAGLADIQQVVTAARKAHGCQVSYTKADHGKGLIFYISGAYQSVMAARGMILKECPLQSRAVIRVARSEVMDGQEPRLEFRRRLDEIGSQTHTRIVLTKSAAPAAMPTPGNGSSSSWSGLETARMAEIVITGPVDCVEIARVRLLVGLDEMSGLYSEALEIDKKLHPVIASRKRCVVQSFQEDTATSIYFPSPLHGLVGPKLGNMAAPAAPGSPPRQDANVIWISGESFNVQRARDLLTHTSAHKAKTSTSTDASIAPRKLDWMLLERADELRTVMTDNGTNIAFPQIGSHTSQITVFGDNRVNIGRTIRTIMQLSCQFYVASFWLLPMAFNPLMAQTVPNMAQMPSILARIANVSGAEVVFKTNCFEMHGLEHEVRGAIQLIFELDLVKSFHHEIRFQLELANEHRDFISGKKNGKINKIQQTTNVKIKFETLNDHNFLIDLGGNDPTALVGLSMLQEELPAEISFHVPEGYHKRIIGVGGKSIQKIMKKWGVYVKFSNAEEFAQLGGYLENDDNVVARTPAKNAMNLEHLKQSVMELVNPKDKDYVYEPLAIQRRFHRMLLGDKHIFIHDIESKTNSRFLFPDKELASDIVFIFGPESQVHIAAAMILEHVPFEAFLAIPPNASVANLCGTQEFMKLTERIRRDYQVSISSAARNAETADIGAAGESLFRFQCQKSNSDFLSAARDQLEQFLLSNNVQVYPSNPVHKRTDSFAEAFPHFPSRLLSTANNPDGDLTPDGSSGMRPSTSSSSRSDLRSHNQSPAYTYTTEESEDGQYLMESLQDSLAPLPPSRGLPLNRHRHNEEALKRGSDSLLESKLKVSTPKMLMQQRAQSLDLGQWTLHHFQEGPIPEPDSPTDSADDSSPSSAIAPSFPSVYTPPSNNQHGRHHNLRGDEDLSRGMANIRM